MTAYVLDVRPMMRALENQPAAFTRLASGDIRHVPTNHDIHFTWLGGAVVQTERRFRCECASETRLRNVRLIMTRQQRKELKAAATTWLRTYWEPLHNPKKAEEIAEVRRVNKQFADHFGPAMAGAD